MFICQPECRKQQELSKFPDYFPFLMTMVLRGFSLNMITLAVTVCQNKLFEFPQDMKYFPSQGFL